jgi:hypothetical protein
MLKYIRLLSETVSVLQHLSKSILQKMVQKLEAEETLHSQHGGNPPAMAGNMVQDIRQRLLASAAVTNSAVAGDRHILLAASTGGKERKDPLISRYCHSRTPTSWHANNNSLLLMASNNCCRKPRYLEH